MRADTLLDEPGRSVVLMGNEAIARGFLEGGLSVGAAYPGTPSSEIMATLIGMSQKFGIYCEWSTNEKVAAEVAISASLSGLRSMVSMKGVGVNVASEPFQAFVYMGARGGCVLVSADDVGCHSSHTEQDNRYFAREAYMPIFEPSDPREARDMAKEALQLSEEWGQPVMLRITTRIAHTSSDIILGDIPEVNVKGEFERTPNRWVNLPVNARRMRGEMILRLEEIQKAVNSLSFNSIEGEGEFGIIASGISYGYVKEAINIMGISDKVKVLKVGNPYPLPLALVSDVLDSSKKVLVVEELEPFVESEVRAQANRLGRTVEIQGKDLIPLDGELSVFLVVEAISRFMGIPHPVDLSKINEVRDAARELTPIRPPVLCPGCGHRAVFYAIKEVERKFKRENKDKEGFVKPTDIGCYTLGFQKPLSAADVNFCMGASIGVSTGLSQVIEDPVVGTIGDSTFFHAGIPPLLNAVFNKANITVCIMDNRTTAMTGFQPHPGVGVNACGEECSAVSIEDIVKACGVKYAKTVDTNNIEELVNSITEGVEHNGPAVIIASGPCRMLKLKELAGDYKVVTIDYDKCTNCKICIDRFGCPAFYLDDDTVKVDSTLCNGCGVCIQKAVCKKGALGFEGE
jgi:indolepyruvate ferredoxin oxidoreductase alpha subunit